MNFENLIKEYKQNISPTRQQEQLVSEQIFKRLEGNRSLFLKIFGMKDLSKNKPFFAGITVFGLCTFFLVPLLFSTFISSSLTVLPDPSIPFVGTEIADAGPVDYEGKDIVRQQLDESEMFADRAIPSANSVQYAPTPLIFPQDFDDVTPESERAKERYAAITLISWDVRDVYKQLNSLQKQVFMY